MSNKVNVHRVQTLRSHDSVLAMQMQNDDSCRLSSSTPDIPRLVQIPHTRCQTRYAIQRATLPDALTRARKGCESASAGEVISGCGASGTRYSEQLNSSRDINECDGSCQDE